MKKLLITILIIFSINSLVVGLNFYVSSTTGDDVNNDASESQPWKTLSKVNSSTFAPGDKIHFKRGDTFYGSIIVSKSGTSDSPITYGAYGTGEKPVITGLKTAQSWTNLGNNIWESQNAVSTLPSCNMVLINGINTAVGRTPNTGFYTYQGASTNVSITSSSLTGTPNWTGAEAVIRKNDWVLDRCNITSQSGATLYYTSLGSRDNGTANFGFFIQNDARTLDFQNEWYYNPSTKKIRVYSATMPSDVKVASVANLFYNNGYSNIVIDDISFIGSSGQAVVFYSNNSNCTVQNCDINYSGSHGISFRSGFANVIDNNTVSNCYGSGIWLAGGSGVTVTNNILTDLGVVPGQANIATQSDGIYCSYGNTIIQYNTIRRTAYNGIYLGNHLDSNATVQYNLIDSFGLVLDDVGGIYTGGAHRGTTLLDHNIILNGIGNFDGTTKGVNDRSTPVCLYLDDLTSGVTVTNNTLAGSQDMGLMLHRARNNTITGNTMYNNNKQVVIQGEKDTSEVYGNIIKNNIFFSKGPTQYTLEVWLNTNSVAAIGTLDNNYYARPVNEGATIRTHQPGTSYVNSTLSQWQSFTDQDMNSKASPKTITNIDDLRFEYNATKNPKIIILDAKYMDVKGTTYNDSITLNPYTSAVLIKDE